MKNKFFMVPALNPSVAETELNSFCLSHSINHLEKHFVADGSNSFWAFSLTYSEGEIPLSSVVKHKGKIDYREVLNPDDFVLFSRLRELRTELANKEGTAPYNIFNNQQLSEIVLKRPHSKTALLDISGIGQTRADKYGVAFMELLKTMTEPGGETTVAEAIET